MNIFTIKDLIEIHDSTFGMDTTGSNLVSEDTILESVFSVSKLTQLKRIEQYNQYIIHKKSLNQSFWSDINDLLIIAPIRKQLEKIELKKKKLPQSLLNIEKAKQYPIGNLLTMKHNKTKCIFHSDHNPSLQYYPKTNTVYCFSCSTYGDAIKVYQKLNNCSFKEAVLRLQ